MASVALNTAAARTSNLRLLSSLLGKSSPSTCLTPRYAGPSHKRSHSTTQPRPQAQPKSPTPPTPPQPSSVSSTELSHFSALASTWWDPHGPSRLLHLMNPLRHDFIRTCLSSVPEAAQRRPSHKTPQKHTYLDIGCGGGIFSSSAARLPSTSAITALDPSPSLIAIAQSHQRCDPALAPPKLTYLTSTIEDLPLPATPDEGVDIITLFEVLEHISSPSSFLTSAIPHLKPGGWIIGSTIARSALSWLTTKLIAEAPVVGVVPRGTHDWGKYINPEELGGWFERGRGGGGVKWGRWRTQGFVYLPAVGWRCVDGSEGFGNYFFGVQRLE